MLKEESMTRHCTPQEQSEKLTILCRGSTSSKIWQDVCPLLYLANVKQLWVDLAIFKASK